METIYDVNWFIDKFEKIPEELWCIGVFYDGKKRCAAGHCGFVTTQETLEFSYLRWLFGSSSTIFEINDGQNINYQQPTPKQRILAALRDVKAKQEPKKEELKVVYKAVYISEKLKEKQLTEN